MVPESSVVTYRWLAALMAALAVCGWGLSFAVLTSGASVQDAQRMQIRRLEQERDRLDQERSRLDAELARRREATASLTELENKLAGTRDDLARASAAYEQTRTRLDSTRTQLVSTQAEFAALDQKLAQARDQTTEQTGTVEPRKAEVKRKRSIRRSGKGRRRR